MEEVQQQEKKKTFGSRFGYLMIAAGAAIGLGNIWKFPYLAYRGGGGLFLVIYLVIVFLLGKPMVEVETSIGRRGGSDTVTSFEKINKKWGFVGWIANACTLLIDFYYVVVGGWCLKYAAQFVFSGDFGENQSEFFTNFISNPWEPLLWAGGLLILVMVLLLFGINKYVEKVTKFIMPALAVLLIACGIYACISQTGAVEGLKYYFLPDFKNFTFKVFADAVTQALFSIGIGWGIFTTLGASVSKSQNIRKDSAFVCIADTAIAVIAGFTIIPAAFGAGIDVQKGPALIFEVMTGIFNGLPAGRLFGAFFFLAIVFAVISSLFTFIEIAVKTVEEKLKFGRKWAIVVTGAIIFVGNIFVSLGFGVLSGVKIPWLSFSGIEWFNFYDWFDCFSGYLLLPLGCLLTCVFVFSTWGWKDYEAELTLNGRDGKIRLWDKILLYGVIPTMMLIVFLNVFGVIK